MLKKNHKFRNWCFVHCIICRHDGLCTDKDHSGHRYGPAGERLGRRRCKCARYHNRHSHRCQRQLLACCSAGATTLQFSFIGFETLAETVGSRTTVNAVFWQESTPALDEIVVVGYGTVKKRDLTGSVSSVRSAEISRPHQAMALHQYRERLRP